MQASRKELVTHIKAQKLFSKLCKPVSLHSAKRVGYSSGKTFCIIAAYRQGNHAHPLPTKGRTHTSYYSRYSSKLSGLQIVKGRALQKFKNCTVVGGYKLVSHASRNYYELVLRCVNTNRRA